ncbi:MAG TPA: MMPL family transporter [Gemmatimonadaceae bacterium]|jgi:RND superfamily putative drug exporter
MSLEAYHATLAALIVRRRRRVATVWLLACLLLLPGARRIESLLGVAARVGGSESAMVDEQLARRFGSSLAHPLVLVASSVPSPATPVGDTTLRLVVDSVHAMSGVARVVSYLDGHDSIFLGSDGGTFLVVGVDDRIAPDQRLDSMRASTARLATALVRRFPGAALRWTGESALNADLRRTSARDARGAEWRALPLSFVLLLAAFGAIIAALLPVAGAMIAIGVSLGLAALAAHVWSLSILLQNVVTMIGLGLGIDYSLLVVQRFRAELGESRDRERAARDALAAAGPTILLSGTAVAIGFGALAVLPVNELRSVAVGGLLVTLASMLITTTLLPGALAMMGGRVDFGRLSIQRGRPSRMNNRRAPKTRWRSWAVLVTRYPALVLVLAALPVGALAWQARRLAVGQPRGNWLPATMESAVALHALEAMGRGSVVQTVRVTVEMPPGVTAVDDSGWAATTRLARLLVADPAVARVRSLPGLVAPLGATLPRSVLVAAVPPDVRASFVSRDGRIAMLEAIPREGATPQQLGDFVRRTRAAPPMLVTGPGAARVRVGGLPALNVDYQDAVSGGRRFLEVVGLIVGATFLVLAIGFRSLLVPLKAIVLNLLAVAAAFGAVTLVFQDGIGARWLGIAAPLGAIFPAIPVLVFCVVFGLSMDYEVFLVARVREARQRGAEERAAIADGLADTARLITSAAAIMIVVFGAFMFADFLLMKMLGFALAVAVLLDATVMRLAVSPALLALAGKWNWWPGRAVTPSPTLLPFPAHAPIHSQSASAPSPSSPV